MSNEQVPEGYDEDVKEYLDELRDGGSINMMGAAPYLQAKFGFEKRQARDVLMHWISEY